MLSLRLIKLIVEIKINYDKCIRCKECIKACAYGVLEWLDDMPMVVNPKTCALCLECEKNCPVNAITHKEK
jgi:NAD-dependent dihydropyrimidine dehydrogenase PreA subunit